MRTTRRSTRLLCILTAVLSAAAISGCKRGQPDMTDDEIRGEFQREVWRVAEYTVRARITALPTADNHMMAYHEAIPEFRSARGLGMDVMDMEFPLADGVSIEGIQVGTIVSITFSVDYEEGWTPIDYRVVEIQTLPPDTQLDFTPLKGEGEVE